METNRRVQGLQVEQLLLLDRQLRMLQVRPGFPKRDTQTVSARVASLERAVSPGLSLSVPRLVSSPAYQHAFKLSVPRDSTNPCSQMSAAPRGAADGQRALHRLAAEMPVPLGIHGTRQCRDSERRSGQRTSAIWRWSAANLLSQAAILLSHGACACLASSSCAGRSVTNQQHSKQTGSEKARQLLPSIHNWTNQHHHLLFKLGITR
jgi:hypothetical protein